MANAAATAAFATTTAQNGWTGALFAANASSTQDNSAVNTFQTAMSNWWTSASASISNALTQASGITQQMITAANGRDLATNQSMGQELNTLVGTVTAAGVTAVTTSSGAAETYAEYWPGPSNCRTGIMAAKRLFHILLSGY